MRNRTFVFLFTVLICCSSCVYGGIKGNGNYVTRKIPVDAYTAIEFGKDIQSPSGKNKVKETIWPVFNYSQKKGDASLEITIDENLFDQLNIEVRDNTLRISGKSKIQPNQLLINGHSEQLNHISLTQGVDLNIVSDFQSEKLSIESRWGSDVHIEKTARIDDCNLSFGSGGDLYANDLHCVNIQCNVSGGSDASLKGSATKADFKASGGSDINAYDFVIQDVNVHASGGSDMFLHATGTIKGKASGGSDVYCKGKASGKISTSGGSDFERQ